MSAGWLLLPGRLAAAAAGPLAWLLLACRSEKGEPHLQIGGWWGFWPFLLSLWCPLLVLVFRFFLVWGLGFLVWGLDMPWCLSRLYSSTILCGSLLMRLTSICPRVSCLRLKQPTVYSLFAYRCDRSWPINSLDFGLHAYHSEIGPSCYLR